MTTDVTTAAAPPKRAWLRTAFKVAVLVAFLIMLFRSKHILTEALHTLGQTHIGWFPAAVIAVVLSLWTAAFRTREILRAIDIDLPQNALFLDLIVATALSGVFVVGSDVFYRADRIHRASGSLELSATIVLLDRLIGLGAIIAVGAVAALAYGGPSLAMQLSGMRMLVVLGVLTLGLLAVFVIFPARVRGLISRISPLFRTLLGSPKRLGIVLFWSTLTPLLGILTVQCLGYALGLSVGFKVFLYVAPLVTMATILPVTIGGIGVREMGYIVLLKPHGVNAGEATALGVLQYATILALTAIGILILIVRRRASPSAPTAP